MGIDLHGKSEYLQNLHTKTIAMVIIKVYRFSRVYKQ